MLRLSPINRRAVIATVMLVPFAVAFVIAMSIGGQDVVSSPTTLHVGPSIKSEELAATRSFFGPMQYSPFHGVNRDNVYLPATNATTNFIDESILLPSDALR